jgi:hypothetical protein
MSRSFRERLALYLIFGMFFFSTVFTLLWVFTDEFSATGSILVGTILGTFVASFTALAGREILDRALSDREQGKGDE